MILPTTQHPTGFGFSKSLVLKTTKTPFKSPLNFCKLSFCLLLIKVDILFNSESTTIADCNVVYSAAISGYDSENLQRNYMRISLHHDLNFDRKIRLYVYAKRHQYLTRK